MVVFTNSTELLRIGVRGKLKGGEGLKPEKKITFCFEKDVGFQHVLYLAIMINYNKKNDVIHSTHITGVA
jgi:hypothetical protein